MAVLFFIISFLASVAGAICGIGGGVIIKPTLDMFHLASVSLSLIHISVRFRPGPVNDFMNGSKEERKYIHA